jgi:hypothetical protein
VEEKSGIGFRLPSSAAGPPNAAVQLKETITECTLSVKSCNGACGTLPKSGSIISLGIDAPVNRSRQIMLLIDNDFDLSPMSTRIASAASCLPWAGSL